MTSLKEEEDTIGAVVVFGLHSYCRTEDRDCIFFFFKSKVQTGEGTPK